VLIFHLLFQSCNLAQAALVTFRTLETGGEEGFGQIPSEPATEHARTRHSAHAPRARPDDHAGPSLFGPVSSGLSAFADPLARDWIILIHRRREKLVARFSLRLLGQHRIGCVGQSLFQTLAWGLVRAEVSSVIEV
jgi:hypothetical protein